MSEPCAGASRKAFRRIEVYTGTGRRRRFTPEEKLELVARVVGCDNISKLARRYDLKAPQLFTWRRELRYTAEAAQCIVVAPEPMFVPPVVEPLPVSVAASGKTGKPQRRSARAAVELVIDGVAVKIARGTDAGVIAAVIDASKA